MCTRRPGPLSIPPPGSSGRSCTPRVVVVPKGSSSQRAGISGLRKVWAYWRQWCIASVTGVPGARTVPAGALWLSTVAGGGCVVVVVERGGALVGVDGLEVLDEVSDAVVVAVVVVVEGPSE